jgi:hypothetical protein
LIAREALGWQKRAVFSLGSGTQRVVMVDLEQMFSRYFFVGSDPPLLDALDAPL